MDHLPRWIVRDISPETESRIASIRFFAQDAEHAKRQWFDLMGLAEDDPDVRLQVLSESQHLATQPLLNALLEIRNGLSQVGINQRQLRRIDDALAQI